MEVPANSESVTPSVSTKPGLFSWNKSQYAWALYECARNPFYVLINIYVFSAYFTATAISDPVVGQAVWGYVLSAAAVIVALLAPLLGAFADAGGRRKPWLLCCILLAIPSIAVLSLAVPDMQTGLLLIVVALVLANVAYELSSIFFNALLPQVCTPTRYGSLSGLAYAFANGAGIVLFAAYLLGAHFLGINERVVPLVVAIWFAFFSIPILTLVPDAKGVSRSAASVVRDGLLSLRGSLRTLQQYPQVGRYLLARMVFNEGFIINMMFLGVFSTGILQWTAMQLSMMGLVLSVVAVLGSLVGGALDDKFGSKAALFVAIAGSLVTNCMMVTIHADSVLFIPVSSEAGPGLYPRIADKVFFFAMSLGAFFVTAALVSSRAMLAKLAPPEILNRMFGLYALSGTATSFLGPLVIALLTQVTASQHMGLTAGILFLSGGMWLLGRVKEY